MKTYTITLHDTDNCGSSLQAYALQHFLLSNNIENEIIDYVPSYVKNNGTKLKTLIRKIVFFKDSYVREKKFKAFKKEFLRISNSHYKSYDELLNDYPKGDLYITGSDQLWNSMYGCGNDPAYYLNFAEGKNKIAYAVSFGRERIPQENLDIAKKYIKDFNWISVREKSSKGQVKKVYNGEIDYVCDPVLLNDKAEYDSIITKKMFSFKYILVYMAQIPNQEYMNKIIEKVKKRVNAKIVLIGSYRNRCNCDIQMRDVAPGDFLSLIANAEYIISNSFHATMFSLIYNKQFVSILPNKNGARIKEILDLAELNNNYIELNEEFDEAPMINNYNHVNMLLDNFKSFSQKALLEHVGVKNEEDS